MSTWKRIACGILILAAGLAVALCFRQDRSQARSAGQGTPTVAFQDSVERRLQGDVPPGGRQILQPATDSHGYRIPPAATGVAGATPPELPPIYHRTHSPIGALLNPAGDSPAVSPTADGSQAGRESGADRPLHKIADGDTLLKLAAQYLGSSERFLEIYELNRDVLPSPDLLPIGVTIKLPQPGDKANSPGGGAESTAPRMVPVAPGALRK